MKTLVLGHGRYYVPLETYGEMTEEKRGHYSDIRCSPLDLEEWYNGDFTSVDMDEHVRPDIVYDLRTRPWTFAEEGMYDRVIDTCGTAFVHFHTYERWFLEQVMRVLKPGGTFYGNRGNTLQKPV